MRQPVLFADAINAMLMDGHRLFLEVGPHPVLGASIKELLDKARLRGQVVASLKRSQPEQVTFYQAFAELYTLGLQADWRQYYAEGGQFVRLPLYPWQRERYWLESQDSFFDRCGDKNDHPLLGHRQNTPQPSWEQLLNNQYLPWLPEHVVQNLVVLPAAAYIEIGLQIQRILHASQTSSIENMALQRALVVSGLDEPLLRSEYDPNSRLFRIYSCNRNARHWTLHAQGRLSSLAPKAGKAMELDSLRSLCTETLDIEVLYARLAKRNLQYSKAFRGLQQAWRGDNQILVRIEAQTALESYVLHPTILDAAFQSLIGIIDAEDDRSFVPVAIGRLDFYQSPGHCLWAHCQVKQRNSQAITADMRLCDDNGRLLAAIEDLRCQSLSHSNRSQRAIDDWLYQVIWEPVARSPKKTAAIDGWLVFADEKGLADQLIARLEKLGWRRIVKVHTGNEFKRINTDTYTICPDCEADYKRLMMDAKVKDLEGLLFAWALDINSALDRDGAAMSNAFLHTVREYLSSVVNQNAVRVYVLTSGAQSLADPANINAAQAALIGLARVVTNENMLMCTLVDIDDYRSEKNIKLLNEELQTDYDELEVALYHGQRYAYRLRRLASPEKPETKSGSDNKAFILQQGQNNFYWEEDDRPALSQNEIEFHIDCAVLPRGYSLGQEGLLPVQGWVSRSNCYTYKVNQAVIALIPMPVLSNYVRAAADTVFVLDTPKSSVFKGLFSAFTKPAIPPELENIGYAAALPDFSRALYALEYIAKLQADDAVLIHAGEDNYDLAAVQIALLKTKNVVATYNHPQKQRALKRLGVTKSYSVTDADFLQKIANENSEGFDVIVNNLSGEIAEKTLDMAKPFARVLVSSISGLHQVKNIKLIPLDISALAEQEPQLYQQLLKQVLAGFGRKILKAPSIEVLKADEFQQALHLCKEQNIALSLGAGNIKVKPRQDHRVSFKPGSYLITGGWGGFGSKLAEWLEKMV